MKTTFPTVVALLIAGLAAGHPVHAQDLTISNVRVIVGNGTVVDPGSILVRGGRITSVSAGAPSASLGRPYSRARFGPSLPMRWASIRAGVIQVSGAPTDVYRT